MWWMGEIRSRGGGHRCGIKARERHNHWGRFSATLLARKRLWHNSPNLGRKLMQELGEVPRPRLDPRQKNEYVNLCRAKAVIATLGCDWKGQEADLARSVTPIYGSRNAMDIKYAFNNILYSWFPQMVWWRLSHLRGMPMGPFILLSIYGI